jgi:acetyltransferase-like isoleucine patch superfamily enzyme
MPLFLQISLFMLVFALGIAVVGTALTPGIAFFSWVQHQTENWSLWARAWTLGVSLGISYLIYGFCLMGLTVLLSFVIPRVPAGEYRFASVQGILWFLRGVLPYVVSKTFLDFLTLSGINLLYFRLMGARIGKGVQINTKAISDFHLISIGEHSMIGGDAKLIGHVGERGKLKLRPIKIGARVTIGDSAIIFPGVEIGDHAAIGAGAIVLKDERVPAGAVYVGVPAENIHGKPKYRQVDQSQEGRSTNEERH